MSDPVYTLCLDCEPPRPRPCPVCSTWPLARHKGEHHAPDLHGTGTIHHSSCCLARKTD